MIDIVSYAVVVAHSGIEKKELPKSHLREKFSFLSDDELKELDFSQGIVSDLLCLPGMKKRKIFIFQSNAKLINAMKILCNHKRILVEQLTKSYFSIFLTFFSNVEFKICSQKDLLQYVCGHIMDSRFAWNVSLSKRVNEIEVSSKFVSIGEKDRAIDGFLKMVDSGIASCAILAENGNIIATLSCSDLKNITSNSLSKILLPVMDFFYEMNGHQPDNPLICFPDDLLFQVTKNILEKNVHECWIVDQNMKPKGLITMDNLVSICTKFNVTE